MKKAPTIVRYIYAEINSYDAIINSHGEPIFEIGNVTPMSIMDVVNNADKIGRASCRERV